MADAEPPILARVRDAVIGDDQVMHGPFGARRVTYADYTASGRALTFIEDFVRDEVLPRYANTHSDSSGTGLQTSRLREDAHIPAEQRPVVFIGPYEHHSNELPWRESIADVVTIPEMADGHIDVERLTLELERYADRPLKIGSFSAASNVTGILTDTATITGVLHEHGALAFWDYAAAGPYVDIDASNDDAVFLSPHKFIGGPGTPGVLIVNQALLTNTVPDAVGGGTVAYVNPLEHRYISDLAHREEAGTPAIIESIRAGLVFALKDAVGVDTIHEREQEFLTRAMSEWGAHPSIQILGSPTADRLSIVSFVIKRPGGRYLHHNVVVAILNDLFGIQSRGGCSCAGPYGHRLLGIDIERSHEFEREIAGGCEGIKPGWVRVSFNYFLSDEVFRYLVDAVALVADHGHKLLPQYRFSPDTGLWRHESGLVEPPLRLGQLSYDADGLLSYPRRVDRAPESALAGYLADARELFDSLPDPAVAGAIPHLADAQLSDSRLSDDFEHLRWFDLPAESLER